MVLPNDAELGQFSDLVLDAKTSGVRILKKWIGNPPDSLKKTDPKVYELLKTMRQEDTDRYLPLIEFVLQTSFFYLFKHLEEGDGELSFSMSMNVATKSTSVSLISPDVDLQLREIVM